MLDLYWQRYPFRAAGDGLHQFDGQAGEWDAAALDGYGRALGEIRPGPSHDDQVVFLTAQAERFWYGELGWYSVCPMVYLEPLDVSLYLKRDYAPADQRAAAAREHARQVPGLLEQARRHLTGPSSASMLLQAAGSAREYAAFYGNELAAFTDPTAAGQGQSALLAFAEELEKRALRAPPQYSMGQRSFERLLEVTQGFALSAERVEELAWVELRRNLERGQELSQGHLAEQAAHLGATHLGADRLLADAALMLRGLLEFLQERQVVSLPGLREVEVRPSPPGARWSFASMDNPGPFEASPEAFYYLTLPDPKWSPAEQEEWMSAFEPGLLHLITLHESIPGHYLQHLHLRQSPSRIRKALRSYTFAEGWAHYCEEMMVEVGYRGALEPRQLELSQVLAALDRCCRLVASIRLHCAGESPAEVARLFQQHAFMEPVRALCSARRGAFDPEYGDYTLGKLMLRKLRSDLPQLSLREFHDQVLSWGSPPPWLLRQSLGLEGEPL